MLIVHMRMQYVMNGNSYGGALYDVRDEVEAYSRNAFFGSVNSTVAEIQTNYPSISDRQTQRNLQNTVVTPQETGRFRTRDGTVTDTTINRFLRLITTLR